MNFNDLVFENSRLILKDTVRINNRCSNTFGRFCLSEFLLLSLSLLAAYSSFEDLADVLTGVSWQLDNSKDASPAIMGRFGTSRWAKTTSSTDQQLIYPPRLRAKISFSACGTQRVNWSWDNQTKICWKMINSWDRIERTHVDTSTKSSTSRVEASGRLDHQEKQAELIGEHYLY